MVFTSLSYFIFLVLIFGVTYSLPERARPSLLLAGSYLFYAFWKASYLWVVVFLTAVDYFLSPLIQASSGRRRTFFWLLSIGANLGLLFVFKYLGFFAHELNSLLAFLETGTAIPVPHLILPLGISFHTFQAISYTTDVYRGQVKAERDPVKFALFIAWFPQMVAGPIERAETLLVQLGRIVFPTANQFREGLFWLFWGLFKKIVIADGLGLIVDSVYASPSSHSPLVVSLAFYGYALQIFCDFSGYTDMAKGSSLLFGVRLSENFNSPYISRSFVEFWKRWHISLSQWFFEYVFYPLARLSPTARGMALAILATFTVSGVWHGANWTFLLWGLANGVIYLGYVAYQNRRAIPTSGLSGALAVFINFNLVCLCWVLFRAPSVAGAGEFFRALLVPNANAISFFAFIEKQSWLGPLVGLLVLGTHAVKGREIHSECTETWSAISVYSFVLLLVLAAFGQFSHQGFIYFQF